MDEVEIPIIIENDLATYEYDSFARDYHKYMDIWNPEIGEILHCKREPTNEVDKHPVVYRQKAERWRWLWARNPS